MPIHESQLLRWLRAPELKHSFRGFDEAEVRRLFDEAANAIARLQTEVARLRKEALQADPQAAAPSEAEAIGRALLRATTTGDQIVAAAREQAEQLIANATAEVEAIRREAAGERAALDREREERQKSFAADRQQVIESARLEADRLRQEARELDSLIASKRALFVDKATAALAELERIERRGHVELVADLHPTRPQ